MRRRLERGALLAVMLAVALLIAPETRATSELRGYASAYAPGRMAEVIRYRLDNNLWRVPLRVGWYTAHGAIATNDCAQVGRMATLIDPAGNRYEVLIADCAGRDGGAEWMTTNNIVAELDWQLWERLTDRYGRPLEIGLR